MSTSRAFTSALRTVSRRAAQAPASRKLAVRSATRRGYASSGHGGSAGAEKSSDMPWLIASVGVTVTGVAWLFAGPSKKASAHHDSAAAHHEPEPEPGPEPAEPAESESPETPPPSPSSEPESGTESKPKSNSQAANASSQTGQKVPPPPADNSDLATDYEAKKAAHEDYKGMVERKDTRAATSSSDVPSKKTAAEHPREDPQRGEGEGVKKGGPE
ncbi:hypothetical protein F4781DRAFT_385642 [Annulohypoxylon bovei var. microspora]|nr:hypothetical protein F4781DRAFT_385642 [Annulohypoxylon bovei var. microspora]